MDVNADRLEQKQPMGRTGRLVLGAYLIASSFALLARLLYLWPHVFPDGTQEPGTSTTADGHSFAIVVVVIGALGGSLHAMGSFATFVGNRHLVRSWTWWYVLRAPMGAIVALILYLVTLGGLLAPSTNANAFNPFGIAALSALAGLMSETATMKLREVFETLFRPKDSREDSATSNVRPQVKDTEPQSIKVGSAATGVRLTGAGFRDGDKAIVRTLEIPVVLVSDTQAEIQIPASLLAEPGPLEIRLLRSGDPKVSSDPFRIQVDP